MLRRGSFPQLCTASQADLVVEGDPAPVDKEAARAAEDKEILTIAGPALLNTLNHFGSSIFSFKPSLIVSYSAGQWGGTRAAHALRPTLSELGCLPVSAMLHLPKAQEVFNDDGSLQNEAEAPRWAAYAARGVSQLEWWGEAAREQRRRVDPMVGSPALVKTPAQRDAPAA